QMTSKPRGEAGPAQPSQAARALADLADPVVVRHRLEAGAGAPQLAARLAALETSDLFVRREGVIALGGLRWAGRPAWLRSHLRETDAALAHAAQQALRRVANWPATLDLLDDDSVYVVALRAMLERHEPEVADGLMERLRTERRPERRREYADALTRIH